MYFIFVLKSTLFTKGRASIRKCNHVVPYRGWGGGLATTVPLWGPGVFTEGEKLKSPIMLRNNIEITCTPKFRFKS